MSNKLTQAILHRLAIYQPTTGLFTRLDGSYFHQYVSHGYALISLGKYKYQRVHRLAFLFMEGSFPANIVDHIDGNRLNNKWENLRHATSSQNMQNQRRARKNNTTGFLGVSKYNACKFEARITIEGMTVNIGVFDTAEEAHEIYLKVKRELHPFGEV